MVISPWSWSLSLKVEKLWSSHLSGGEVEEEWRRSGAVEKAPAMHKLSDSSLSGIIVDIITLIVTIITLITINNSVDQLHHQYSTMIDRLIIIIAVYSWQWSNQEASNNQIQICYCVWILFVQSESLWQNCENRVQLRGSCQFRASHNQIRCSGVRPHVYFYLNDFIQVCRSDV